MIRKHYPTGTRLPALEQNILKYRAFEMILFIFYAEDLKEFAISTIQATDSCMMRLSRSEDDQSSERIGLHTKKKLKTALDIFVTDGILTSKECREIRELVDFRNDIAHRLHDMTYDLARLGIADDIRHFYGVKYNYEYLRKVRAYRHELSRRTQSKYVVSLSFNSLLFEGAAKTYDDELKRLGRKIRRLMHKREEELTALRNELALDGTEFIEDLHPNFPANKNRNGKLTKRGIEVCYRLFDHGKSPLAVAHLMKLSLRSAINRQRAWEQAGGSSRMPVKIKRYDLSKPFAQPTS